MYMGNSTKELTTAVKTILNIREKMRKREHGINWSREQRQPSLTIKSSKHQIQVPIAFN